MGCEATVLRRSRAFVLMCAAQHLLMPPLSAGHHHSLTYLPSCQKLLHHGQMPLPQRVHAACHCYDCCRSQLEPFLAALAGRLIGLHSGCSGVLSCSGGGPQCASADAAGIQAASGGDNSAGPPSGTSLEPPATTGDRSGSSGTDDDVGEMCVGGHELGAPRSSGQVGAVGSDSGRDGSEPAQGGSGKVVASDVGVAVGSSSGGGACGRGVALDLARAFSDMAPAASDTRAA
jgi:hypothetical protein